MKYKPEKDIPDFAREYKTLSPSKLSEIILMRRNKKVTPESVTMWLKRHPKVADELAAELVKGLPTAKEEVDSNIFQTGTFEALPSVKNWLVMLQNRELVDAFITQKLNLLRRVCMGKVHTYDLVMEGKWSMKHPDRLTLQEVMELIALLRERGVDTYMYKRDLKDFLESKGIPVGKTLVVGKPKRHGEYATLFADESKLEKLLSWIKSQNYEAYVADRFMYKTGTRVHATLEALIENLHEVGNRGVIKVYDKGRHSIYPKGHPWDKYIEPSLLTELKTLIGDRTKGKIFRIDDDQLSRINKIAIQRFLPDVLDKFPDLYPNHFWRHMFAQHMLRKTLWNYAIVASLGGWTVSALEESYGKPPETLVEEWAKKYG